MIAIGCDHGGFALKQEIMAYLDKNGYEYKDLDVTAKQALTILSMRRKYVRQSMTEAVTEEFLSAEQESVFP